MFVGIVKITVIIADAQSLKFKRQGVLKIKDSLKAKFNCSVAEVGDQELWQKTILGFSIVGVYKADVESQIQKMIRFIEGLYVGNIIEQEIEVFSF